MQASRAESRINKNNISSTSADTNQRQSHVWMSRKWHAWLKQTITLRRILNEYFNSKRKIPNKCAKPYDAITYSFCFATPLTVPEFGLKKTMDLFCLLMEKEKRHAEWFLWINSISLTTCWAFFSIWLLTHQVETLLLTRCKLSLPQSAFSCVTDATSACATKI